MLTANDLDDREKLGKAISVIDHKKLTSLCLDLAESLNEIYSSLYEDDLDNKFTLITRAWINEPTERNKEKALDFAEASRGYCRIASGEAGRHYNEHNFNHYLSCASILECCYAALMTIKKDNKYVIWCIREYILAREMIARDLDQDDKEEYVNSFKDGLVEKLNEMKERHDQQVDSADGYVADNQPYIPNVSQSDLDKAEKALNDKGIFNESDFDQPYTPQVGEECEYETTFFSLDKSNSGKCKIIAYHNDRVWIDMADGGEAVINMKVIEFRPLKTERDKLLEQAVSNFSESELAIEENIKATCYRLIDAGWRPTND